MHAFPHSDEGRLLYLDIRSKGGLALKRSKEIQSETKTLFALKRNFIQELFTGSTRLELGRKVWHRFFGQGGSVGGLY